MLLTRITNFSLSPSHNVPGAVPLGVADCNECPCLIRVHVYGTQAAGRVAESVNSIETSDLQLPTPNKCNDQRPYLGKHVEGKLYAFPNPPSESYSTS